MHYDDQQIQEMLRSEATRIQGFEAAVRQYSEMLYWQVRRIVLTHDDANDVVQNVLLKAWRSIDNFHGDSLLSTWLSRIAINESIDFERRQRQRPTADADDTSVSSRLAADEYFDGDRAEMLLQEAIATLPEIQRKVFLLRYYDEMKYSEMSRMLDTSEGSLKASYHIAVKKITDFLRHKD